MYGICLIGHQIQNISISGVINAYFHVAPLTRPPMCHHQRPCLQSDNIDEAFFEKPETRAAISSAVADQINAKAGKKVVSKASVLVTGVKVAQGRRGRARALAGKSVTADYMILNQGSSKETAALSSAVENIGTDAASGTAITAALKADPAFSAVKASLSVTPSAEKPTEVDEETEKS
jgi:hypothetical protein